LEKAVREGRFRADLYYRLNIFPIHVPALRERKDDIPLLARHFLTMHSHKIGKDFQEIHEGALSALMQYDWPGNIRELENTIERAMILNQPPLLRMIDLPSAPKSIGGIPAWPGDPSMALSDNERRHILWTLEKTNGRVSGPGGAAELLKINPSTLRFRIKKLGIQKSGVNLYR